MSTYAAGCKRTGNYPYIQSTSSWGRTSDRVVYAVDVKEAKAQHGWTRAQHTSITIRRATTDDQTSVEYGWCGCVMGVTCIGDDA